MTIKLSNSVLGMTHLKVGCQAPLFRFKSECGTEMSLADLKGKKVILFFYPKDLTPGCTIQACNLRDNYKDLTDQGFSIIGISADDAQSHAKFMGRHELPFPLVPDTDLKIINEYGVWGPKHFLGINLFSGIKRTTFIINEEGIIECIIENVNTINHTKQILESLNNKN
jgi:peroxiredoxin Q/BCP